MEKFCHEWKDFEFNIQEYFRKQRKDKSLCDVTLATEDGQEIKAHKIVLSSGSEFFCDIFLRNNHPNMYIFLKGVRRPQLEQITDLLYNGEVFIAHDEMKHFFETAKLLQIKGLREKELKPEVEFEGTKRKHEVVDESLNNIENHKTNGDSASILEDSVNDGQKDGEHAKDDLDRQIAEMIEKTEDGKWKCKICGKLAIHNSIKRHAEIHIEGLSYTCHVCGKSCSTRQYLGQHISNNHTGGVFSCKVCNKTGMKRNAYHVHKNMYHKKKTSESVGEKDKYIDKF